MTFRARVLGVDLGLKRTGLAVSDELFVSARPLPNLIPKSRAEDINYILNLCVELCVGVVVIGYPVAPANDDEGFMAKRAANFVVALTKQAQVKAIPITVQLLDETMTSKTALQRLVQSGISKKRRRQILDSEAARILVEEYIANHQLGAGHVK